MAGQNRKRARSLDKPRPKFLRFPAKVSRRRMCDFLLQGLIKEHDFPGMK